MTQKYNNFINNNTKNNIKNKNNKNLHYNIDHPLFDIKTETNYNILTLNINNNNNNKKGEFIIIAEFEISANYLNNEDNGSNIQIKKEQQRQMQRKIIPIMIYRDLINKLQYVIMPMEYNLIKMNNKSNIFHNNSNNAIIQEYNVYDLKNQRLLMSNIGKIFYLTNFETHYEIIYNAMLKVPNLLIPNDIIITIIDFVISIKNNTESNENDINNNSNNDNNNINMIKIKIIKIIKIMQIRNVKLTNQVKKKAKQLKLQQEAKINKNC